MISIGLSFLPSCPSKPLIPISILTIGTLIAFQNCINYYSESCFRIESYRNVIIKVTNVTINVTTLLLFISFTFVIYFGQFESVQLDHKLCIHNESFNAGKRCINDLHQSNETYYVTNEQLTTTTSDSSNSTKVNVDLTSTDNDSNEQDDLDESIKLIGNYCNPILYTFSLYFVNFIVTLIIIIFIIKMTVFIVNCKTRRDLSKTKTLNARV